MTVENISVQPPVNSRDMNSVNGPVRQLFSSRSLKSAVHPETIQQKVYSQLPLIKEMAFYPKRLLEECT